MEQKKPVSRSTYRAILQVGEKRDKYSGLQVTDRYFEPGQKEKKNEIFSYIADFVVLSCILMGLFLVVSFGFHLPVSGLHILTLFLMAGMAVLLFRNEFLYERRLIVGFVLFLLFLTLLFVLQTKVQKGAGQFVNHVIETLNDIYNGSLEMKEAFGGKDDSALFFMLILLVETIFLSVGMFWIGERYLVYLAVFPILIIAALCGVAGNTFALFLLTLGLVLSAAYTNSRRQKRMWGKEELKKQNRARFFEIRTRTIIFVFCMSVILSVPGFLLVKPFLSFSLAPMRKVSSSVQGKFLNQMLSFLPKISAGEWELKTEAIGGGVSGGSIRGEDGYVFDEIEDLRLVLDSKPKDTIFLKGFIGSVYENGNWEGGVGSTFDGAAMNWNTDKDSRLYMQNLMFLRMVYAGNNGGTVDGKTAEPVSIKVEKVNANSDYTYVPYGTYLNEYYVVEDGDGFVKGQDEYSDEYYFFPVSEMKQVLTEWAAKEDTSSILDRQENAYRLYANRQYTQFEKMVGDIPAKDVIGSDSYLGVETRAEETLSDYLKRVKSLNRWDSERDLEEITAFIRGLLVEKYSYNKAPDVPIDDIDPLMYFITEKKEGNSVQFASFAVMLYRMFEVPARYVIGYEMSEALFIPQPDGTYTGTAEGDNSQAFVEIYTPGIGWLPEDMTPGVIGTIEEIGAGGTPVEILQNEKKEDSSIENASNDTKLDSPGKGALSRNAFLRRLNALTMEELIRYLIRILLFTVIVGGMCVLAHKLLKDLGYSILYRSNVGVRLLWVFQAVYHRLRVLGLPKGVESGETAFRDFCNELLKDAEISVKGKNKKTGENVVKQVPLKRELFAAVDRLYESFYGDRPLKESDVRKMRRVLIALWRFRKVK